MAYGFSALHDFCFVLRAEVALGIVEQVGLLQWWCKSNWWMHLWYILVHFSSLLLFFLNIRQDYHYLNHREYEQSAVCKAMETARLGASIRFAGTGRRVCQLGVLKREGSLKLR
jgi:hypothetical protein